MRSSLPYDPLVAVYITLIDLFSLFSFKGRKLDFANLVGFDDVCWFTSLIGFYLIIVLIFEYVLRYY